MNKLVCTTQNYIKKLNKQQTKNNVYKPYIIAAVCLFVVAFMYPPLSRPSVIRNLQKDHRGTKFMADCYLEGKGVSRDKSLAKDLYREAAAAGNEEAKEIMKKL